MSVKASTNARATSVIASLPTGGAPSLIVSEPFRA
jgi:hypothetical protein